MQRVAYPAIRRRYGIGSRRTPEPGGLPIPRSTGVRKVALHASDCNSSDKWDDEGDAGGRGGLRSTRCPRASAGKAQTSVVVIIEQEGSHIPADHSL